MDAEKFREAMIELVAIKSAMLGVLVANGLTTIDEFEKLVQAVRPEVDQIFAKARDEAAQRFKEENPKGHALNEFLKRILGER